MPTTAGIPQVIWLPATLEAGVNLPASIVVAAPGGVMCTSLASDSTAIWL